MQGNSNLWALRVIYQIVTIDTLNALCKRSGKPREPIKITLPDGREVEGKSWETTPYSIAADISKQMADRMVISEVLCRWWSLGVVMGHCTKARRA